MSGVSGVCLVCVCCVSKVCLVVIIRMIKIKRNKEQLRTYSCSIEKLNVSKVLYAAYSAIDLRSSDNFAVP